MKIYPSLEQDYPSLADINYQLEQTDTTLIFGTPSKVLSLYQQMVDEPNLFRRAVAKDIGTDGMLHPYQHKHLTSECFIQGAALGTAIADQYEKIGNMKEADLSQ